jgi:hypothetical protein
MASVSNSSAPAKEILVVIGTTSKAEWFSYSDEDTVKMFKERIATHAQFSADELELHAHYKRKWLLCCDVVSELDDANDYLRDVLVGVNHISVEVFAKVGHICNCHPARDLF